MTFLPAFTQLLAEGKTTFERLRSSSDGLEQISPASKREVTGLHLDLQLKHPVVARRVDLDFQVLGAPEGRVGDLGEIELLRTAIALGSSYVWIEEWKNDPP